MNRKTSRLAVMVASCLFALSVGAAPLYAGSPLVTDDAGTVEAGKVEIGLNGSYIHDRQSSGGVTTRRDAAAGELHITTGLYTNVDISLTVPRTFSDRTKEDASQLATSSGGLGDMTVVLKYSFGELAGIAFAIKPKVIMPTGRFDVGLSEGRWQFGTTLIATRAFEDGKYALHGNLGYEHHDYRDVEVRSSHRGDLWSGSIAGEMKLLKGLAAVADLGVASTADRSTSEISVFALTGARYELNEHIDMNAGIKLGLTKPENDLALVYGVTIKF